MRRGGTYLITGGLGGLGRTVALWLADKFQAKLILVGRPRPDWQRSQRDKGWDAGTDARMADLRAMEAAGAELLVISADVAEEDQLRSAIQAARERFGRIDGIFHAAGLIHNSLIKRKLEEDFNSVVRPKVHGAWLLDQLTRDDPPDFLLLFSSIAGIHGNVFQADYSAACHFLDSFAAWRSAQGHNTYSIDWGLWAEAGLVLATSPRQTSECRGDEVDSLLDDSAGWATGIVPMPNDIGLRALEFAFQPASRNS